jgi:4-amino-4-deoxy-L-arabinose transferase
MRQFTAKLLDIRLGLFLLFILIYLLPLNLRQLGVPDEMRYGEIAREMIASGDYVTPRLDGLRYFEKPAGGHVLNAAAMKLFGETNFAVRLMSTLATGLSAWAIYLLAMHLRGKETAFLSAFIFLTCGLVMGIGTYSVLDSMFSCLTTLALCFLYPALDSSPRKKAGLLAMAGLATGGAFLVKGFIAWAVPVVVIVPYLLLRRQWKQLFVLPWIPAITALTVALPWSLAIAEKEPDFWRYFFWEENIRRFFSHGHAQHANPFWYFIPVFLAGAIPWCLIAPLPLRNLLRQRIREPQLQFILCWLIMPFLFFSASSGKLGTYILPCFAPFAILLGQALHDHAEHMASPRSMKIGIVVMGTIVCLALCALPVVATLNSMHLFPAMDAHYALKMAGLLMGLGAALALVIGAFRSVAASRKSILLGLSAAAIFVTVQACAPTEVDPSLGIQAFLKSEQRHIDPDTILVGNPKTIQALCYVYKRDDIYLTKGSGELTYGLSFPDAKNRCLEIHQLKALISQRGSRRVVLVLHASPSDSIRAQLPLPTYQRQWLKIWFVVYEPLMAGMPTESQG